MPNEAPQNVRNSLEKDCNNCTVVSVMSSMNYKGKRYHYQLDRMGKPIEAEYNEFGNWSSFTSEIDLTKDDQDSENARALLAYFTTPQGMVFCSPPDKPRISKAVTTNMAFDQHGNIAVEIIYCQGLYSMRPSGESEALGQSGFTRLSYQVEYLGKIR